MADNIVKKTYRILTDAASKTWDKVYFKTSGDQVEFNDGKSGETKLGAINGITDSLTSTSSNVAASAKAINTLNSSTVSDIYVGDDGKLHKVKGGADSVIPFSSLGYEFAYMEASSSANASYGIVVQTDQTCKVTVSTSPATGEYIAVKRGSSTFIMTAYAVKDATFKICRMLPTAYTPTYTEVTKKAGETILTVNNQSGFNFIMVKK